MPRLPLEALLVGRRMRLTSQSIVFTIGCVTLTFSLLTALHDVTTSLRREIEDWADEALVPYAFFRDVPGPYSDSRGRLHRGFAGSPDPELVAETLQREGLRFVSQGKTSLEELQRAFKSA